MLFVVFVDLFGQGPIFLNSNWLIIRTKSGFLPDGTATDKRHLHYSPVISCFSGGLIPVA